MCSFVYGYTGECDELIGLLQLVKLCFFIHFAFT